MTTEAREVEHRVLFEIAERIAPTWERRREQVEQVSTPVREWLVRELRVRPGNTVLDIAAGLGETGFDAAALVGDGGRLITSDFSPTMLAAARRRGAERGISNVDYQVVDAQQINLADDSVDAALCRFGYMLMLEPAAALAETRRVLRPGGRLTFAVWGAPQRNPFFCVIVDCLVHHGHIDPPAPPPAPGIFSMADAGRVETLLHDAGFDDVRIEQVPVHYDLHAVDEYLNLVADTAGPIGLAMQALPDAELVRVKTEVADSFRHFAIGTSYRVPGAALCAAGS